MKSDKGRIGILTGGGDCPGLNAVIRAVTKSAILEHDYEVVGFEDGYYGLVEDKVIPLTYERVSGILATGGTILGTSNRANPFEYWRQDSTGEYVSSDESDTAARVYARHGLDALICVGGDGSMTIGSGLASIGLNVVGIPKTIDNDLYGTEESFGFHTAVSIITDAIDRIHTTAMSHHRVMTIEVMGRNAGWLALTAGIAGGGDIILIPEIPYDLDTLCKEVTRRSHMGSRFSIIIVAEGAKARGGEVVIERIAKGSPDPVRLGGIGRQVAQRIESETGTESRATVLGHLQRGGPPSAHDRVLGTLFGKKAMDLVVAGEYGRMVSLQNGQIGSVDISVPAGRQRKVPLDHPLIAVARSVGTIFGDEDA